MTIGDISKKDPVEMSQPHNLRTSNELQDIHDETLPFPNFGEGGIISKKVIVANINGSDRILTPVSSPQRIGPSKVIISTKRKSPSIGNQAFTRQKTDLAAAAEKTYHDTICKWKFEDGRVCGKVFTKFWNLRMHMKTHQDVKPFSCNICGQAFRQKAHLQRHEGKHGVSDNEIQNRFQSKKIRQKKLSGNFDYLYVDDKTMSNNQRDNNEEEGSMIMEEKLSIVCNCCEV